MGNRMSNPNTTVLQRSSIERQTNVSRQQQQQQHDDEEPIRRYERRQQERWRRAVSRLTPDLERLQQNDASLTTWTCRIPNDELQVDTIAFYNTLGRALQQNTHLETLVLHHFITSNDVGSSDPLIQGIVQSKVHNLTFKCAIPTTTATTTITSESHSENDDFSMLVSRILEDSATLTRLELVHATLGNTGMTLLAQAIHGNTTLTSLVMEGCDVGVRGLGILFEHGLRDNTTLTQLHMERCHIDDDAVQSLVEYWHPESPLETLALRSNCIESRGAQLLVQAARQHSSLHALDLSYNRDLDYEGLRLIGNDLADHRHLTRLGLFGCATINVPLTPSQNNPEEVGQNLEDMFEVQRLQQSRARRLAKQRRTLAEQALLEGLKSNLYLTDLNVLGNELLSPTENEIDFYIHRNRMGGYLLSGNQNDDLPTGAWCFILAQCQTRMKYQYGTSLTYFDLRENPTLLLQSRNRP